MAKTNQLAAFNERIQAFNQARERIVSEEPKFPASEARKLLAQFEAEMQRAISANNYEEAERALWRVMIQRAHVAVHDFPMLYGRGNEADDGASTRHYESLETSVREGA